MSLRLLKFPENPKPTSQGPTLTPTAARLLPKLLHLEALNIVLAEQVEMLVDHMIRTHGKLL